MIRLLTLRSARRRSAIDMGTGDHQILQLDDLPPHDAVRRQRDSVRADLEARAAHLRQEAERLQQTGENARPTEMKLPDQNFCKHCGRSIKSTHPFGDHAQAVLSRAYGVTVEIYPNGGVIVFAPGGVTVSTSTRRSQSPAPLGSIEQFGATQVVISPENPA